MENTIGNRMSVTKKLENLYKYMSRGGEVEIDGYTYVWLDNHITEEVELEDGTKEYYGIDGLAMKMIRMDSQTKEETPYYIGMGDLTLNQLVIIINKIDEETWLGITASNALVSMIPDRG